MSGEKSSSYDDDGEENSELDSAADSDRDLAHDADSSRNNDNNDSHEEYDENEENEDNEKDQRPKKRARLLSATSTSSPTPRAKTPGILYVSRLPPNMNPHHLRLYLRDLGALLRVYCAPEHEEKTQSRAKKGGNKRRQFTEAWVEFARRKDAKNAALLLNGRPMGGKNKRAAFYYDLWNVKYLKKFTWDHLTDDLKKRKRLQDKKLVSQISQAKREALAYLDQREQARVGDKIIERRAKQQERLQPLAPKQDVPSAKTPEVRDLPKRRDERKRLDDSFLAQFLGQGGGSSKSVKRPRED